MTRTEQKDPIIELAERIRAVSESFGRASFAEMRAMLASLLERADELASQRLEQELHNAD